MSALYHIYHPDQKRANRTVSNWVRRGKLINSEVCERFQKHFSKKFIEGHHWSYKRQHWGDPNWLCRWCHKILHQELGKDWADLETKPDLRLVKPTDSLPVKNDDTDVNPMGIF